MPRNKRHSRPDKILHKKVPLDKSMLHKTSIQTENKLPKPKKSPKSSQFEESGLQQTIIDNPQLYFIKVMFLVEHEYLSYLKYKIKLAVRNSKQRSQDFIENHEDAEKNDLTLDFVFKLLKKQNFRCAITNIPIIFANEDFPYHLRASIDRIDSNKGYTRANIQLVSLPVNHAKSKGTNEQIIKLVDQISFFYYKK